jgi:fluoride exporter
MEMLWVAIGGALGSILRYALNKLITDSVGNFFPFGILLINIIGSLVIGFSAGYLSDAKNLALAQWFVPLVMIGVCGGFTTFSSFSLQTWQLIQSGEWIKAALNVFLSVLLCLAATAIGFWLSGTSRV